MSSLFYSLFFLTISSLSLAEPHKEFDQPLIPPEFREEAINEEVKSNRADSTGSTSIKGLNIAWQPEKTTITGDPIKIREEYESIRATILKSPTMAKWASLISLSTDGKTIDLSGFLDEMKKHSPNKVDLCFAVPLWYFGQQNLDILDDVTLIDYLKRHRRKRWLNRPAPGDVVILKDKGNRNDATHAYLQLSPNLALEKRGGGAFLARPPEVIQDDYQNYMRSLPDGYGKNGVIKEKYKNPMDIDVYTDK